MGLEFVEGYDIFENVFLYVGELLKVLCYFGIYFGGMVFIVCLVGEVVLVEYVCMED